MFTSLTETNPASEYRNPASRSFGFDDSSISDNSGLGSCYADRDSDTLSNGRGRDRPFAC